MYGLPLYTSVMLCEALICPVLLGHSVEQIKKWSPKTPSEFVLVVAVCTVVMPNGFGDTV